MCRCVVLEGKLLYAVFLGLCKRYVFIRVLCSDDKLNYLREYSPVSVRCETSIRCLLQIVLHSMMCMFDWYCHIAAIFSRVGSKKWVE